MRQKLTATQESLETTTTKQTSKIESLTGEIERLKLDYSKEMSNTRLASTKELSLEKEKLLKELDSERRKHDKAVRDLEIKYESELKQLNQKHTQLNTTHQHLLIHSQTLENNVTALHKQIEGLTSDCNSHKFEMEKAVTASRLQERQIGDLQKENNKLRGQLKLLEQRMVEKDQFSRKTTDLYESVHGQKVVQVLSLFVVFFHMYFYHMDHIMNHVFATRLLLSLSSPPKHQADL